MVAPTDRPSWAARAGIYMHAELATTTCTCMRVAVSAAPVAATAMDARSMPPVAVGLTFHRSLAAALQTIRTYRTSSSFVLCFIYF